MYFDIITNKTDLIPLDSSGHYIFNKPDNKYPYRVYIKDKQRTEEFFYQLADKLSKYDADKLICLDFHGVADLYDKNEVIPGPIPKMILSYVGGNPKTIGSTTNTIISRIKSKEILFGIIVYLKKPEPICGTKGWILSHISLTNPNLKIHFIDDGKTNIECVNKLDNPNIIAHFNDSKKPNAKSNLTTLLEKI